MNLIINLIIKIFEAIFEEDRLKREQREAQIAAMQRHRRKAREGDPQAAEQFFMELFGEQLAPPPPPRQPPPTPRKPAAPGVKAKVAREESYEEHLAKFEERSHRQDKRTQAMQAHVDHYLGAAESEQPQLHAFKLPGNNPLEQALFAGIIFGPCKAHQALDRTGVVKKF